MCCVIAAGCYRPAEVACGITCAAGTCPGQLVCNAADQLCYAPASGACSDAGVLGPGPDDGDGGPSSNMCYGHDPFKVCVGPPAGFQRWTSRTVIDTDACPTNLGGQYVNVGTVSVCALVASDFDIATTVEAHGSRPLVLVSLGAIVIAGTIDVGSHPGKRGPASNTACTPPAAGTRDTRGIGGAGGSFRGRGGDGAVPTVDGSHPPALALDPIPLPTRLVGGCAGGDGGGAVSSDMMNLGDGSAGGASGGALYLVAVLQVALQSPGWINASGAGGRQVVPNANNDSGGGGGGGGSGGLVRIDAPNLAINGAIVASGGGGASGAPAADSGAPGGEPDPTKPEMAAPGGAILAMGGRGGAGNSAVNAFAGETPPGPTGDSGGGGGGGGGGHIVLVGTRTGSGLIIPLPE